MKIIITENQQRNLSYMFTVGQLIEQKRSGEKRIILKDIVADISRDLNSLLPQIAGSEESTWKMTLTGDDVENLKLTFKGKKFPFKPIPHTNQSKVDVYNFQCGTKPKNYGGGPIYCSNFEWRLQIPNLFDKFIGAYPQYGYLFEGKFKNDEQTNNIKNQINNVVVTIGFERGTSNSGDKAGIIFELVKNNKKMRRKYKSNKKIYIGTPFQFYDLVQSGPLTPLVIPISKTSNALLWHAETQKILTKIQISPPPTPAPIDDDEGIVAKNVSFKFQVTDPFQFDKPDLTTNAEDAIATEMDKIYKLKERKLLERYLTTKINGKNIVVEAFSSIDAKSDEVGGGDVSECSPGGTTTRAEYNLCLSQKRAETIVNHLKSEYPDIFGEANLIAKGMGELRSKNSVDLPYSDPLQKAHRDANRVATKADRKFVLNLPDFEATIKSSD